MKKTIFALILLVVMAVPSWAVCSAGVGDVSWTITPELSQIYGSAGSGVTQTTFLMQGFVGVMWLSAPEIRLTGSVVINDQRISFGPNNSGGPGYRVLVVPNNPKLDR